MCIFGCSFMTCADAVWQILYRHSKCSCAPSFLTGVGFCAVLVAFYVSFYYNVIIGWALYFLVASATPDLPWLHCNNTWNTDFCIDSQMNGAIDDSNNSSANNSVVTPNPTVGGDAAGSVSKKLHFSPASEYFQ